MRTGGGRVGLLASLAGAVLSGVDSRRLVAAVVLALNGEVRQGRPSGDYLPADTVARVLGVSSSAIRSDWSRGEVVDLARAIRSAVGLVDTPGGEVSGKVASTPGGEGVDPFASDQARGDLATARARFAGPDPDRAGRDPDPRRGGAPAPAHTNTPAPIPVDNPPRKEKVE